MRHANPFPHSCFFLDFETTGLDPRNDHVLEVGLCGAAELNILVSDAPEACAPALRLHGLSHELRKQEGFPSVQVLDHLLRVLGEAPSIVAHNAIFERGFLETWADRTGRTLPAIQWHCTLERTRMLVQRNLPHLSLGYLAVQLGWDTEGLHRAGCDAALTRRLWKVLDAWEVIQISLGSNPGMIYLAGPFRGDGTRESMEANTEAMKRMAQWVQAVLPGAAMVVPHLNFGFLDEAGEHGLSVRETVLSSCELLVRRCDAFIACGEFSPGMQREANVAQANGIPIHVAPGWDLPKITQATQTVA